MNGWRYVMMGALVAQATCGVGTAQAAPPRVRLATFQCDVTPPLGGHPIIWVIPLAQVEDPLLAKGVVFDDGQRRYVLCAVDWCGLCNSSHLLWRKKLAEAVGTEVDNVAVQCVHQHTAPYTDGDAQRLLDACPEAPRYVDFRFLEDVTDRLATAAREALARLEPVDRVGLGQAVVQRVASSRRIPDEGGKIRGRSSSATDPALRALPEGLIDPVLRTISLARGETVLVRMHYYATHPQSFYGDPRASADVPGIARTRLETQEGVFQVYFTGCAGDVAMGKYNDRSPQARTELAERLYAGMEASVASTRWAPLDAFAWRTMHLVLPARNDPGYTVAEQRKRMADPRVAVVPRVRAATAVAYAQRSGEPLWLGCVELGPARLLLLPGECMVEFQLFAQREAPDRFVAVAAYGDLGPGYICTAKAYQEGGYEPSASHVGPEAEALLKKAIGQLLAGP